MTRDEGKIRQIAFFCEDIRAAAVRHNRLFSSGPFFIADRIELARATYRGCPSDLIHSSAYGQWGDLMVEFVQQDSDGPSAFYDLFPNGAGGLHHCALFVDDLEEAAAQFATEGHEEAFRGEMKDGFTFLFIDTSATLGHMIELYRPEPNLTAFYAMVADAAKAWDGTDPLRTISLR